DLGHLRPVHRLEPRLSRLRGRAGPRTGPPGEPLGHGEPLARPYLLPRSRSRRAPHWLAQSRWPNRPDRIEDRGREHWLRVREAYLDLWRQSPGRICRIETAGKPPEAVAQEVLAHVDRWVGREAGGS